MQHADVALIGQQPRGERGPAHVDRRATGRRVRGRSGEQRPEPALQGQQAVVGRRLRDPVQLREDLGDDARGPLVLPPLHQRHERVPGGVFEQVGAVVGAPEVHRPLPGEGAQRPGAPPLVGLGRGQQLQHGGLAAGVTV